MSDTAIVSAAAAFVTAVAAGIAYGQWQTARWKLAADLFSIRHEAYQDLMLAFESWYKQGPITDEMIDKFVSSFNRARYLFGPEVRERLDQARLKITDMANAQLMISRYNDKLELGNELDQEDTLDNEKQWNIVQNCTTYLYKLYTNENMFLPYLAIDYQNPFHKAPLKLRRRRHRVEDYERGF